MDLGRMRSALERGVEENVFPGGVLLAALGGGDPVVMAAGTLSGEPGSPAVTPDVVYDLASLTKILSTTVLTMNLVEQGALALENPLIRFWPDLVPKSKEKITLRHLLSHASGAPAWRPFYEYLSGLPDKARREAIVRAILAEPFDAPPGARAIYSDVNFILLGLMLEKATGKRQDQLFREIVAGPLGLSAAGYRPVGSNKTMDKGIAPTSGAFRRGGTIIGEVNDDNAWGLSGTAGHAGLFAPVRDVWLIFSSLIECHKGTGKRLDISVETVREFWAQSSTAPGSTWALGFDMPSQAGSSAGTLFSGKSVGHLGFTGTSLWHDPEKELTVILLTNRVYPTALNQKIRKFRPFLHDEVVSALC